MEQQAPAWSGRDETSFWYDVVFLVALGFATLPNVLMVAVVSSRSGAVPWIWLFLCCVEAIMCAALALAAVRTSWLWTHRKRGSAPNPLDNPLLLDRDREALIRYFTDRDVAARLCAAGQEDRRRPEAGAAEGREPAEAV